MVRQPLTKVPLTRPLKRVSNERLTYIQSRSEHFYVYSYVILRIDWSSTIVHLDHDLTADLTGLYVALFC